MVCPELRWAFEGVDRADSLVVNAHKWMLVPVDCSLVWSRGPRRSVPRSAWCPSTSEPPSDGGDRRVRACSRPPLPLAEAVGGASLLRAHGVAAADPRAHPAAELFESWVRDEAGWEISAPATSRSSASRREGSDEENEELLERVNASGESSLAHEARRALRAPPGGRTGAHDGGRRACCLGRAASRGRGPVRRPHTRHAFATHPYEIPQYAQSGRRRGWPRPSAGAEGLERSVVQRDAVAPESPAGRE